jgi:hypothetical protein
MKLFTLFISLILLSACDRAMESSDYIGGFVTITGGCQSKGDLGLNYKENHIDISFYCFLKECSTMKGDVSKEGFFHLESPEGYFIQGKIKPKEASGNWFLNIKGKNCYGQWVGLEN